MLSGKGSKDPEHHSPDTNEEDKKEQGDGPAGSMLAGPEISPVATIRSREPVILYQDHDKEPLRLLLVDHIDEDDRQYSQE